MSSIGEVPKANDVKKSRVPRKLATRLGGALLAVGMIAGGTAECGHQQNVDAALQQTIDNQQKQLNRESNILGALNNVSPSVIAGQGLYGVDTLPGRGTNVTVQNQQLLQASAVKVVDRQKGSNGNWNEVCSGNKVSIADVAYVSLAAHCFSDTRSKLDIESMPSGTYDILPDASEEYAVVAPADIAGGDSQQLLAQANAVSINVSGLDQALMRVDTSAPDIQKTKGGEPVFAHMPALTFNGSEVVPIPGESVVTYGMPGSNRDNPVAGSGIYLGRINDSRSTYPLDIVALNGVQKPNQDSCSYGASGSAAMIGDGFVTGALSMRNNVTFDPNGPNDNSPDNPQEYGEPNRLRYEQELKLNLDNYPTICGYSVVGQSELLNLAAGFSQVAPLAPSGGMK